MGGNNILPMRELQKILGNIGFMQVRTYIQSGNVVLESSENNTGPIANKIADAVMNVYSFKPHIMVLDVAELQNAIRQNPFSTSEGKALHFYFLAAQPKQQNLETLTKLKIYSEKYQLKDKVFYLYAPEGIWNSKLAANVEKCLGVPTTARNLNTVNKVFAIANEP